MNDHQITELYVWSNGNLAYFRDLLRKLGGNDIPLVNTYRLLESMHGIDRPVVLSFGKVGYGY